MTETKPFNISKRAVVTAYEKVKANKGTYGVDEQSIEDFEKDLKNNLYKIWNRMSSGSYIPKPVRAVAIPKKNGGTRLLGIPSVEDRIAQMVVKLYFEPEVEPMFYEDSYDIDLISLRYKHLKLREKGVGEKIGFLNLI
jgi:RNA-directed DNA polymerase